MDKIILIDDHPMILTGLSSFLENESKWTVKAKLSNLKELSDFLKDNKDLEDCIAIVDVEIGQESGFDAVSLLSKNGIKCLMYSMYSSSSFVLKATECGAKGYISKSSSNKDLLEALDYIKDNKVYIQKELIPQVMFTANIMNSLTKKEKMVIEYVRKHLDNYEIAEKMNISVRTVENYLSRIYDKYGVQNKHQLEEMIKE